jgi:hypothetical protein
MPRWTALFLVLALTATSASRLACVWECTDETADAHAAASCHESSGGDTLGASASHCPLTPEAAELWTAKGHEPQRLRPTLDTVRTPNPASLPNTVLTISQSHLFARSHTPGAILRSTSVLRI